MTTGQKPGKRLVQEDPTSLWCCNSDTISQRYQKQPKIRRVEKDIMRAHPKRCLCSQDLKGRDLCCVRTMKETLWKVLLQSDPTNCPPRFCFYTLWYIQQSQNHTTTKHISCQSQPTFWPILMMLPKFCNITRFLGIFHIAKNEPYHVLLFVILSQE